MKEHIIYQSSNFRCEFGNALKTLDDTTKVYFKKILTYLQTVETRYAPKPTDPLNATENEFPEDESLDIPKVMKDLTRNLNYIKNVNIKGTILETIVNNAKTEIKIYKANPGFYINQNNTGKVVKPKYSKDLSDMT